MFPVKICDYTLSVSHCQTSVISYSLSVYATFMEASQVELLVVSRLTIFHCDLTVTVLSHKLSCSARLEGLTLKKLC